MMALLSPCLLIIVLNKNGLNPLIKRQRVYERVKKKRKRRTGPKSLPPTRDLSASGHTQTPSERMGKDPNGSQSKQG